MAKLEKEYDVIVIGAGINGIACAAYLQKAGLKVACFERRHEAGVHCCTEELMHPGVKVNSCALDVITLGSPAYDVALDEDVAYVATDDDGIYAFGIEDLSQPVLLKRVAISGGAKRLAFLDGYLIALTDIQGLRIYTRHCQP